MTATIGHGRRLGVALGVLLVLVGVVGCSGTGNGARPGSVDGVSRSTSASPSPSPSVSMSAGLALPVPWASQSGTAAQQTAAVEALAAYRGMWTDLERLGRTPMTGFKDPTLATHMLYQPLHDWSQTLADEAKRGEVSTGEAVIDPRVVKVDTSPRPTQVEIADCFDNTRWPVVDARTLKPVDNTPGTRRRTEALATLDIDGYWKVTQQVFGEAGSC
ncbi:hypothetical protein ABIA33_001423 [Streptacidiphilus sp. MAP12-16]|uniref:hypothetical protein n=1 Tax=Streptacidiphilus sp. MAP12-16 TaxID=3156300 RepID=UPI003513585B